MSDIHDPAPTESAHVGTPAKPVEARYIVKRAYDSFILIFEHPPDGPSGELLVSRVLPPKVEPPLTGLRGKAVGGSQSRNLIVVLEQGKPK